MGDKIDGQQIKVLDGLWHELLNSNKLNICIAELEGVTTLEVSILRVVGENPEIILREICRKLNVVNSTLTSAINRLEKRKLLYRTISSRDLRSFGLQLTEQGKDAISKHIKAEETLIKEMLKAFESDNEREEFVRLFGKLVGSLVQK